MTTTLCPVDAAQRRFDRAAIGLSLRPFAKAVQTVRLGASAAASVLNQTCKVRFPTSVAMRCRAIASRPMFPAPAIQCSLT